VSSISLCSYSNKCRQIHCLQSSQRRWYLHCTLQVTAGDKICSSIIDKMLEFLTREMLSFFFTIHLKTLKSKTDLCKYLHITSRAIVSKISIMQDSRWIAAFLNNIYFPRTPLTVPSATPLWCYWRHIPLLPRSSTI